MGTPGGLRLALGWEPSRETRPPDSTAHEFPFIASLALSVWSSVSTLSETPETKKKNKKKNQNQNPFREICRPINRCKQIDRVNESQTLPTNHRWETVQ